MKRDLPERTLNDTASPVAKSSKVVQIEEHAPASQGLPSSSSSAPASSSTPVLPTLDVSTEDDDKTVDYGEFSCWWMLNESRQTPNHHVDRSILFTDNDFDLYHAIDDAYEVLHAYSLDQAGQCAWKQSQACLVIPGPFRSDRCFYYDFKDDECFSVSSDDILTEHA